MYAHIFTYKYIFYSLFPFLGKVEEIICIDKQRSLHIIKPSMMPSTYSLYSLSKGSLPPITPKQMVILSYIFTFRFVSRSVIQTLLNHSDPRRINAWLKDLVEKKYLGRIYHRTLTEMHTPAILCCY